MNTKKIVLQSLVIFLLSCSNHTVKSGVMLQSHNTLHGDSIDSTEEGEEPSDKELFKYAYSNLIKSYKHNQTVDTLFVNGKDSFHVKSIFSCLHDGKVIVPKRYVHPFLNKDFITHNFFIHLVVHKNNTLLIDKNLYKDNFYKYIDEDQEDIKRYGTLLFSGIRNDHKNILIDVTVRIPLRDLGVGLVDTIKTDR